MDWSVGGNLSVHFDLLGDNPGFGVGRDCCLSLL